MKITVKKSRLSGEITAPPSKSYAHRLIIASFLSGKCCSVRNVALSDDIKATLECIKSLGGDFSVNGDVVTFSGNNRVPTEQTLVLPCNESGSTLRFFIPIAAMLYPTKTIVMKGTAKLLSRGLSVYEELLDKAGHFYNHDETSFTFSGAWNVDNLEVRGDLSSQYITGLMFAASVVGRPCKIKIIDRLESRPYINITADVLNCFGVNVAWQGDTILVDSSDGYKQLDTTVEGDYSNAAFLEAFNYIDDNRVKVRGLSEHSVQGDKVYKQYFDKLKSGTPSIDISDCIDLGPILFGVATVCNGATFSGIKRLRAKESDRVQAMCSQLCKFGAKIDVTDETVTIHKAKLHSPTEELFGQADHRIVMTLFVMLTHFGGVINGAEAVNKSFPDFFEKVKKLGAEYEIND